MRRWSATMGLAMAMMGVMAPAVSAAPPFDGDAGFGRGASAPVAGVTTGRATLRWTLDIDGLMCEECAHDVAGVLRHVPGVQAVHVDFASGRGTVEGDRRVTAPALEGAFRDSGYRARASLVAG